MQTQTRIQEPCNIKDRDFRNNIQRLETVNYCRKYLHLKPAKDSGYTMKDTQGVLKWQEPK